MTTSLDDYLLIRTIQKGDYNEIGDCKRILQICQNPGTVCATIDAFFVGDDDRLHYARFDDEGNFLYRREINGREKSFSVAMHYATMFFYAELISFLILFLAKMSLPRENIEIESGDIITHSLIGLGFYAGAAFRKADRPNLELAWDEYQRYTQQTIVKDTNIRSK